MKTESNTHLFRRGRISIIACMLENSNEECTKTRLLCRCNLNPSQFSEYNEFLVESGLPKASRGEDDVEIFEITDKGREFLKDYGNIKNMLR